MKLMPTDPTTRTPPKRLLIAGVVLVLLGIVSFISYRGSVWQLVNYPPAARLRLVSVNDTNRTVVVADNGSSDRDGRIVEWRLDWGNGQRDILTNRLAALAHVYDRPGEYVIRLVCLDDLGATNRVPMTLHARIAEAAPRLVATPALATVTPATNTVARPAAKEEQTLLNELAVQREQARTAFEARQQAETASRRLVEELTARKAELAGRIQAEEAARRRAETAVGALRTELAGLEMQADAAHLARLQAEQQVRDLTEQLAQVRLDAGQIVALENHTRNEAETEVNRLLTQRTNQIAAARISIAAAASPRPVITASRSPLPAWAAAPRTAVAAEKTKAAPDMMRELAKTPVRVGAPAQGERRVAVVQPAAPSSSVVERTVMRGPIKPAAPSSSVVERTVMREAIKPASPAEPRIEILGERGRVLPDGRMEVRLSVHGENTGVRVQQWQVGNRIFPRTLWLPLSLRAGEHQAKVTVRDDAGRVLTTSAVVKVVIDDQAGAAEGQSRGPGGAVAVQPR